MRNFQTLSKLLPGDQVAIISPSNGLPEIFPWVHELGIKRIEEDFGLKAKEYTTTRKMGASVEDRAKDVMDAFSDPKNKAVIATIGGEDQIRLTKYLDKILIKNNPKPFFGFSDNTHLHIYLWNLGIPSYYGGAVMTQFAMQNGMHDFTTRYLKKALFKGGIVELESSEEYTDEGLDWADRSNLQKTRRMEPNDGWFWDGTEDAEGVLWGGCVESLIVQSTASKFLPADDDIIDTVLFLETAEDIPEHWIVEYLLTGFGERGWLDRFRAVVVGRPKAWEFDKQNSPDDKANYRAKQRETILKTIRFYNKSMPVVQNLDFGHTDPQISLPMGRKITLNSKQQSITVDYN
jgi:muramoyltetrapeptide carboxypeptidase LdcA involved in peptidoglycan recycling